MKTEPPTPTDVDDCTRTVPATPLPASQSGDLDQRLIYFPSSSILIGKQARFKVPIIAPPCSLIPDPDSTTEAAAVHRLSGLLEREKIMRKADELGSGITDNRWLRPMGNDECRNISECRENEWDGNGAKYAVAVEASAFLNVGGVTRHASCDSDPEPRSSNILALGIDDFLRTEVIEWILQVPSHSSSSPLFILNHFCRFFLSPPHSCGPLHTITKRFTSTTNSALRQKRDSMQCISS